MPGASLDNQTREMEESNSSSMVNNAGIAKDVEGLVAKLGGTRIHETETATFDLTMSINVRSVFLGCKYAIAQFLKQQPLPVNSRGDRTRGWIVNTASTAGIVALAGGPSYITSKHAVVGMTKQVAIDYAKDRIHCNALCPSCKSNSWAACSVFSMTWEPS